MTDASIPTKRPSTTVLVYAIAVLVVLVFTLVTGSRSPRGIALLGGSIPMAFALFVLVLLAVALFHHHTLWVALAGAVVITVYTGLFCPGFEWSPSQPTPGLLGHFTYEGEHTLLNLGGLLLGFALLAKYFETSGVPDRLPRLLPKNRLWSGFVLLALVWFISSFLDNIAAAMIGGVMARSAFKGKVSVGYIAAIVAASNAGGAWSVLGDTTTTMMWIEGVSPLDVAHGIIASTAALLVFGLLASMYQNRLQSIEFDATGSPPPIDWARLGIVAAILAGAIATNFWLDRPFIGVWVAILLGALLRKPAWGELPGAAKGAVFLLSLVWCASLMPVSELPAASWQTAFALGWVSAVFDNIPLTKLGLEQNGYDWGMLAYSVGFGGSMIWFGSSAGVAISKDFPEARNTGRYLKEGWPVILAYVVGFFALLWTLGWQPHPLVRKGGVSKPAIERPADGR